MTVPRRSSQLRYVYHCNISRCPGLIKCGPNFPDGCMLLSRYMRRSLLSCRETVSAGLTWTSLCRSVWCHPFSMIAALWQNPGSNRYLSRKRSPRPRCIFCTQYTVCLTQILQRGSELYRTQGFSALCSSYLDPLGAATKRLWRLRFLISRPQHMPMPLHLRASRRPCMLWIRRRR